METENFTKDGLLWVDVSDNLRSLLIMYEEFFIETYDGFEQPHKLYKAIGNIYTHDSMDGTPQTDPYTMDWWTNTVYLYELFSKCPSESVKHLDAGSAFIKYMARRVAKDTFLPMVI